MAISTKQVNDFVTGLVREICEINGATAIERTILCGGKPVETIRMEGGIYDESAARSILLAALKAHREAIVTYEIPRTPKLRPTGASSVRVGPDGKPVLGSVEENVPAQQKPMVIGEATLSQLVERNSLDPVLTNGASPSTDKHDDAQS